MRREPDRATICAVIGDDHVPLQRALAVAHGKPPGTVLAAGREGIDIACGDGALRIRALQREGGKTITAADYLNARRDLGGFSA